MRRAATMADWVGVILIGVGTHETATGQPIFCNKPTEPFSPNAFSADRFEVERARDNVDFYVNQINDYGDCLVREIEATQRDAGRVIDRWNREARL